MARHRMPPRTKTGRFRKRKGGSSKRKHTGGRRRKRRGGLRLGPVKIG